MGVNALAIEEIKLLIAENSTITRLYEAIVGARINWLNMVEAFEKGFDPLGPPWGVIQFDEEVPMDWGLSASAFSLPVTFFLIYPSRNDDGSDNSEAPSLLRQELESLRYAVQTHDTVDYQLVEPTKVRIDTSHRNEANRIFLSQNWPLLAGTLRFEALIGFIGDEDS